MNKYHPIPAFNHTTLDQPKFSHPPPKNFPQIAQAVHNQIEKLAAELQNIENAGKIFVDDLKLFDSLMLENIQPLLPESDREELWRVPYLAPSEQQQNKIHALHDINDPKMSEQAKKQTNQAVDLLNSVNSGNKPNISPHQQNSAFPSPPPPPFYQNTSAASQNINSLILTKPRNLENLLAKFFGRRGYI